MVAPLLQNGLNENNSEGRGPRWGCPFTGRDGEEEGGREAGGGGQVTRILSDAAADPDGGRGRSIRGGVSQLSHAYSGRKGPLQEISEGGPCEEAPEVPGGDGGSPQDPPVSNDY